MAYTYSIDDPAKNSKRMLAFALVVIIHVLFVYVLASGLGKKVVEVVLGPVETHLIEELPDEDEEPPPPPPEIDTPPPYVPPPEISIDIPTDCGPTTAISNVTSERPVAAPPPIAAPKPVERAVVKTPPSTQGRGRAHHAARVPARVAPCRRGRHGAAQGLRARKRPRRRASRSPAAAASRSSTRPRSTRSSATGASWPARKTASPSSMWHTFDVTFRLTD